MNYKLDPLHAITARPRFLRAIEGQFSGLRVATRKRKPKPVIIKPVIEKFTIVRLATELKIHPDAIVYRARQTLGKGGNLTSSEYDILKLHLINNKIKRRMKRKT